MSNSDVESHFLRRRRGVFRNLNSIGSPGVGRSLANLHGRRPGIRRRISRGASMNRILRYCSVSLALAIGFTADNGPAIRQALTDLLSTSPLGVFRNLNSIGSPGVGRIQVTKY